MIRALWTAATGMSAQQLNVDLISNNLANVNTSGYKKSRVDFEDLYYQTLRSAGSEQASGLRFPTGLQIGMGTAPVATQKDFSQGDYQQTGNPLDLAIEGNGFFQVLLPDNTKAYTRSGAFKIDSTGKVVTSDGYPLEPALTIPQDSRNVSVGSDGTVTALVAGATTPTTVGTLEIARFVNPAGLSNMGHNLYSETSASGVATTGQPGVTGLGKIVAGTLEMSNVRVVDEMVSMILAQRAYEVNSKAIQTADEMIRMANNIRG